MNNIYHFENEGIVACLRRVYDDNRFTKNDLFSNMSEQEVDIIETTIASDTAMNRMVNEHDIGYLKIFDKMVVNAFLKLMKSEDEDPTDVLPVTVLIDDVMFPTDKEIEVA